MGIAVGPYCRSEMKMASHTSILSLQAVRAKRGQVGGTKRKGLHLAYLNPTLPLSSAMQVRENKDDVVSTDFTYI